MLGLIGPSVEKATLKLSMLETLRTEGSGTKTALEANTLAALAV